MSDYNVNVNPLLGEYNHVDTNKINSLIPADDGTFGSLAYKRGYGLYNPAPAYPQTHDYGNALSNVQPPKDQIYGPVNGNLYETPNSAVQTENSWNKNINYNIEPPDGVSYQYYDEYQEFALKSTNKNDPYLLPYFFSKINVNFIQKSVVEYVKKARNITIKTEQDIDSLLNIMVKNYLDAFVSNGITGISGNSCLFKNILGNLNKITIEEYVQSVLSSLNMTEYYLKDISTLPVPLSNPVLVSNKGKNELGFVGFFENNHDFTKNLSSFNTRDLLPGN